MVLWIKNRNAEFTTQYFLSITQYCK